MQNNAEHAYMARIQKQATDVINIGDKDKQKSSIQENMNDNDPVFPLKGNILLQEDIALHFFFLFPSMKIRTV